MLTELDLRKVAVAGAFDDLRRDTMATMSHYSRVLKVVIDAPPSLHDQELAFWQGALGQELPEKKTLKNRLQVDITVSGGRANPIETRRRLVDAEAQRLEALGATLVRVICEDGVDHYAVATSST
jgi:hypothetical protein